MSFFFACPLEAKISCISSFSVFLMFVWLKATMHNETQPTKSPAELLLLHSHLPPNSLGSTEFLLTILFYCSAEKHLVKVKFPSASFYGDMFFSTILPVLGLESKVLPDLLQFPPSEHSTPTLKACTLLPLAP